MDFKHEYLLNSLSKIKHKKYELYVISRVIFDLDDWDIEFVCQQYVKTPTGRNFVDLYFPQFRIYLKVNELYHNSATQKELDKHRDQEILESVHLKPFELNIFGMEKNTPLTLIDINKKISNFCDILREEKRKALAEGSFIPWTSQEARYDISQYKRSGKINVDDNVIVRRQYEALNLLGANYKGWQKAWWKKDSTYAVWFPKLYDIKSSAWDNKLSDDGRTIIERRKDGAKLTDYDRTSKRIVFGHQRNNFGKTVYKFLGVFSTDLDASSDNQSVHKLEAKTHSLNI